MPGAGAGPIGWAASIAAIPTRRNAWPRCAALEDFANRIHSPGRPTAPPPETGIAPSRPSATGALISASAPAPIFSFRLNVGGECRFTVRSLQAKAALRSQAAAEEVSAFRATDFLRDRLLQAGQAGFRHTNNDVILQVGAAHSFVHAFLPAGEALLLNGGARIVGVGGARC